MGNTADGSVQLFTDQSGGVCLGCGFETSGVLPARRKASLRNDGEPIEIVVGSFIEVWSMLLLSGRQSRSS